MIGLIGAGYCGYWLVSALRKDYFRGSRKYGHRYIYRRKQPQLYWTSVILMTGMLMFALGLAGWALVSQGSFHHALQGLGEGIHDRPLS